MEKILLFGAGGFLANEILKRKTKIIAFSERDCDITDRKKVLAVVKKHKPSVIINCAAITDLKYCEEHPLEAWNVNVIGVRNISEAAKKNKSFMIHFSSNYAINPLNEYSWTKIASEHVIDGLVIRTSFYDTSHWIFQSLKSNQPLKLLKNYYFNPITINNLLDILFVLLRKKVKGIVNVGIKDKISYYDLGVAMCDIFGFNKKLIKPITNIKLSYDIPKNAYLNIDCLKKFNIKPISLKEDLTSLKRQS